jgi:uncharacterized RDD family membrane protein YckC
LCRFLGDNVAFCANWRNNACPADSACPTMSTSVANDYTTPSRRRRFACMMYEGVLLFGVVFLAGYLFDTLTQSRNALMLRHARQAILFLAMGIYFVACWHLKGQTLPMKTWHIRLVDNHGHTPRIGTLFTRYLLIWPLPLLGAALVMGASQASGYSSTDMFIVFAPFLSFVYTWFDEDGQFLHDRLLGTRLVNTPRAAKS